MLELFFRYPRVVRRLRGGGLGGEMDRIAAYLAEFDYKRASAKVYLSRLGRFSDFVSRAGRTMPIDQAVVDRLTDYTNLLYQLATADSPARAGAQARDLGGALNNLSTSVAALTGADNEGFKRAVTTVLPVLGDVLQTVVQQTAEHALQKAIAAGAAPVNSLIEAIKVDAEVAYQRKRTALSKRRADAAVAYNAQVARGDAASLRRLGDAVAAAEDQWEAFQTARPAVGLEAMQRANLALETFARTRHPGAQDLSSFVGAMETFAATAARLGEDVARLRELGKDAAR